MEATEIIKQIKGGGRDVARSSLRMALVYILRKEGYQSKHISSAVDLHRNNVDYYYNKALDFIDNNDKPVLSAIEELEQHEIILIPHFHRKFGKFNIRTHLEIDHIKL